MLYNGKEYARVSQIISRYSDFSHIDPEVLNRKAQMGTEVHEAINDDINMKFPVVSSSCQGYLDSYLEWKNRTEPVFLKSESRYFDDKMMITGCIDALAVFQGSSEPVLVDFKTSAQESREVWPMQAHLYDYLLRCNGIDPDTRFLFVKLDKWGKLPMVFEYKYDKNIMAKCMEAIDLYWKDRKSDSNKSPDLV